MSDQVDTQQLKVTDDLTEVMIATNTIDNWRRLGLALGIPQPTLNQIKQQYPDPLDQQEQILSHWIETGEATWAKLVTTIGGPLVNKKGLSNEIARNHPGYSRKDETNSPGSSIGTSGSKETKCYDAFKCGRREEALKLLKEIDDPHTVKSNDNFTILHCAAYNGWLSVVKELINDHIFDPDCMDDDGNTPLMTAKSNNKQPVVDFLEKVIKKKCYDAFEKGKRQEASRLLKQVEDPSTVMSNHNFTILHCAAYNGWLAVVKELINVHKCDPDCKDDDGTTPLSNARSNGKQSVVDYLEKHLGIAPIDDRPSPRPIRGQDTTDSKGAGNKDYRALLMKSPELNDVFPLLAKLSSSWHDIGGRLGIPIDKRLSLLRNTAISDNGKLEEILHVWICSQPSDVTWKRIIDVLIAFEKKNVASEVEKFLDKQRIYEKYIQQDDFVSSNP